MSYQRGGVGRGALGAAWWAVFVLAVVGCANKKPTAQVSESPHAHLDWSALNNKGTLLLCVRGDPGACVTLRMFAARYPETRYAAVARWVHDNRAVLNAKPRCPSSSPARAPRERQKATISLNNSLDGLSIFETDANGDQVLKAWFKPRIDRSVLAFVRCDAGPVFFVAGNASGLANALAAEDLCDADMAQMGITRIVEGAQAEEVYRRIRADDCCHICSQGHPCLGVCFSDDMACPRDDPGCAC